MNPFTFVVEWDADLTEVINVYSWNEWLKIPVWARPLDVRGVYARDKLDAYKIAMTGANNGQDAC